MFKARKPEGVEKIIRLNDSEIENVSDSIADEGEQRRITAFLELRGLGDDYWSNGNSNYPLPKKIGKAIDSLISTKSYCRSEDKEKSYNLFIGKLEARLQTGQKQKDFIKGLEQGEHQIYLTCEKEVKKLTSSLKPHKGIFPVNKLPSRKEKYRNLREDTAQILRSRLTSIDKYLYSPIKDIEAIENLDKYELIRRFQKSVCWLNKITNEQLMQAKKLLIKENDKYKKIETELSYLKNYIEAEDEKGARKKKEQLRKMAFKLKSSTLVNAKPEPFGSDIDRLFTLCDTPLRQIDPSQIERLRERFFLRSQSIDQLPNWLEQLKGDGDLVNFHLNLINSKLYCPIYKKINNPDLSEVEGEESTDTDGGTALDPEDTYWMLHLLVNLTERLREKTKPSKVKKLFRPFKSSSR